jgi:anti-anti-sigma regulatory factor
LREAEGVRSSLLNALKGGNAVEVDCTDATEIDVSFPQLLISACRMAADLGKTLVLSAPASGVLRDTLLRGGFLSQGNDGMTPDRIFWSKGSLGQS